MNAPLFNEMRGIANREVNDEKMEQIREILIGDAFRSIEARFTYMDNRINELEVSIARQLDALEARIETLANASEGDRREAFETLAASVSSLSEEIRRISRR